MPAIEAADVRKVRFAMALRGYRMSDVDWALERMADELDRLRTQVIALSGPAGSDEAVLVGGAPGAAGPDDDAQRPATNPATGAHS